MSSFTIDQVLCGLRMHESGGDYRAQNPYSSASGAYQYIDRTWGGYRGFARAKFAPPAVQDERARRDRLAAWERHRDWEVVIADHFYPAWATRKDLWRFSPSDGNPTVRAFVDSVLDHARADVCRRAAPPSERLRLSPLVVAAALVALLLLTGIISGDG